MLDYVSQKLLPRLFLAFYTRMDDSIREEVEDEEKRFSCGKGSFGRDRFPRKGKRREKKVSLLERWKKEWRTRNEKKRFASRLAAHHRASTSFFLGNRWSGFVVDEDLSGLGGLASEAADPRLLKSARGGCRSSNFQRARQFVTPLQNARERKTRPILTVQR